MIYASSVTKKVDKKIKNCCCHLEFIQIRLLTKIRSLYRIRNLIEISRISQQSIKFKYMTKKQLNDFDYINNLNNKCIVYMKKMVL